MKFLRYISIIEAISYLLLLIIAMPLKYLLGIPEAVQITGMLHGCLFVILLYLVVTQWYKGIVSTRWALIIMGCSLIPLVPFFLDRKLKTQFK